MKRILCFLICLPYFSFAQVQINSFLGITFGSCKEDTFIQARSLGAVFNSYNPETGEASVSNIGVAGVTSSGAYFDFIDDRFYKGVVEFSVGNENTQEIFNALKYQLSTYYGYGKDFSWFESPYYPGAGNELAGIAKHKAKMCHVWADTKDITSGNFISIEVCADKVLRLYFKQKQITNTGNPEWRLSANK